MVRGRAHAREGGLLVPRSGCIIFGPELFSTIPGLGVGWPLKLEFTPEFPIRVLFDVRNSWEKAGIRSGILHLKFWGCP